ncbi:MAG TPA: TonB-dependent receptor plug domain-containing protein [Thermoanaerobaculia bacterium]|jgi:outer membrane receptor for ferrienterochelin and colicin
MKPIIIAALLGAAVASNALAQSNDELSNLSVEDLMKVEVTSVARRGQRLSETAAATFVISEEDIHRSGATSIPDLLRMVPGFDVAQINRNLWAVSARGFNGRWSNKLLVLIDGRTVYSELFGGVRWDVQDLPRYVRLDARVAWQARPGLELSVSGRNLAGGSHLEFRGFAENAALTPASRTIAGMILWRR